MIFSIYLAPLLLRMNLYWSITQATPLFLLLRLLLELALAAAAALASFRTSRCAQHIFRQRDIKLNIGSHGQVQVGHDVNAGGAHISCCGAVIAALAMDLDRQLPR